MINFGPKLSYTQYAQALAQVRGDRTLATDQERQRQELNTHIDYCFGQHFPSRRRVSIWEAYAPHHHRVRSTTRWMKKLSKMIGGHTSQHVFASIIAPIWLPHLARCLSKEELLAFVSADDWSKDAVTL